VSFGILERNDGAVVQIIYSGKPEGHISITGTVIDLGSPREVFGGQSHPINVNEFWAFPISIAVGAISSFLPTSSSGGTARTHSHAGPRSPSLRY
jgi:hypothetical protein